MYADEMFNSLIAFIRPRSRRGLKPCPFCGHVVPEFCRVGDIAQVQCPNCDAAGPSLNITLLSGDYWHTEKAVAQLWNKRKLYL